MTTNEHTPTQDLEASLAEQQATEAFEYTRQDGTIERAQTAKEVFDKCPVLGKIALESPDLANTMLELAAIGKAKMQEQVTEPEPKNEAVKQEKLPTETAVDKPAVVVEQYQARPDTEKTIHKLAEDGIIRRQVSEESVVRQETHQKELPVTNQVTHPEEVVEANPPAAHAARTEAYAREKIAAVATEQHAHEPETTVAPSVFSTEYSQETPVLVETEATAEGAALSEQELSDHSISDEEVQEVFELLQASNESILAEDRTSEIEVTTEPQSEGESQTPQSHFETFLAETIKHSEEVVEPITLSTLQESAREEAPLEEVFVQLVQLLKQPEAQVDLEPLQKVIAEIRTSLMIPGQEQLQPIRELTPEITRQLLVLLAALGYEHPGDVLVKCVSAYDIRFLLDALYYLGQLNLEENRQEFLNAPTLASGLTDGNDLERLGKLLFQLVSRLTFEPRAT